MSFGGPRRVEGEARQVSRAGPTNPARRSTSRTCDPDGQPARGRAGVSHPERVSGWQCLRGGDRMSTARALFVASVCSSGPLESDTTPPRLHVSGAVAIAREGCRDREVGVSREIAVAGSHRRKGHAESFPLLRSVPGADRRAPDNVRPGRKPSRRPGPYDPRRATPGHSRDQMKDGL